MFPSGNKTDNMWICLLSGAMTSIYSEALYELLRIENELITFSRTSVAQTFLGLWKFVLGMGSLSH